MHEATSFRVRLSLQAFLFWSNGIAGVVVVGPRGNPFLDTEEWGMLQHKIFGGELAAVGAFCLITADGRHIQFARTLFQANFSRSSSPAKIKTKQETNMPSTGIQGGHLLAPTQQYCYRRPLSRYALDVAKDLNIQSS
jgi:photosystem II stability/assembly factor-like uncharacterized protein